MQHEARSTEARSVVATEAMDRSLWLSFHSPKPDVSKARAGARQMKTTAWENELRAGTDKVKINSPFISFLSRASWAVYLYLCSVVSLSLSLSLSFLLPLIGGRRVIPVCARFCCASKVPGGGGEREKGGKPNARTHPSTRPNTRPHQSAPTEPDNQTSQDF